MLPWGDSDFLWHLCEPSWPPQHLSLSALNFQHFSFLFSGQNSHAFFWVHLYPPLSLVSSSINEGKKLNNFWGFAKFTFKSGTFHTRWLKLKSLELKFGKNSFHFSIPKISISWFFSLLVVLLLNCLRSSWITFFFFFLPRFNWFYFGTVYVWFYRIWVWYLNYYETRPFLSVKKIQFCGNFERWLCL